MPSCAGSHLVRFDAWREPGAALCSIINHYIRNPAETQFRLTHLLRDMLSSDMLSAPKMNNE
jgi:hypothetical protein